MIIAGVYTPDVFTIPITGATTEVWSGASGISNTQNGAICLIIADLAGDTNSTLTINKGTWNIGTSTFTPDSANPRLAFLRSLANGTASAPILFVMSGQSGVANEYPAFEIITTGDADTTAHIRVQGTVKKVS